MPSRLQGPALALYQRGILSSGKACALAGVKRWEWEALLGARKIPRHYADEDLEQDKSLCRRRSVTPPHSSTSQRLVAYTCSNAFHQCVFRLLSGARSWMRAATAREQGRSGGLALGGRARVHLLEQNLHKTESTPPCHGDERVS